MSTGSLRRQGPRYRRRRPLPALVLLGALVLLSGLLWTRVFESVEDIETATRCNQPAPPTAAPVDGTSQSAPPPLGKMLPRNALDNVAPVPPQQVKVRVLNGNGEVNQASLVSGVLTDLGFAEGGEPDNDPVYVNYDLNCHGQIRFGSAGAGAARTLSLIAPCAQLVHDGRTDDTIDFALGTEFNDIKSTSEAKQVMQQLKSQSPGEDSKPKIDEELLAKARDVHC